MTVSTIVTQPARGSSSAAARARRMERLGALDAERLYLSLAFLAGYRPRVFDAALDATEPGAGDEPDPLLEPEPFCTVCGAGAGIFWLLGEEWRHYRPSARSDGKPEVYDPGHAPVIGWRAAGNDVPALTIVPVPVIQRALAMLPAGAPAGSTDCVSSENHHERDFAFRTPTYALSGGIT